MHDIETIGQALIVKAKKVDVIAVRELFDRAFGKSPQTAKIDLSDDRMPIPILDPPRELVEKYDLSIYGGLSQKPEQA